MQPFPFHFTGDGDCLHGNGLHSAANSLVFQECLELSDSRSELLCLQLISVHDTLNVHGRFGQREDIVLSSEFSSISVSVEQLWNYHSGSGPCGQLYSNVPGISTWLPMGQQVLNCMYH